MAGMPAGRPARTGPCAGPKERLGKAKALEGPQLMHVAEFGLHAPWQDCFFLISKVFSFWNEAFGVHKLSKHLFRGLCIE